MVKKSLFWVYRAALWLTCILFVVLLFTLLGVHFLLMPNINQYKDAIAEQASKAIKQKVAIGHIQADWQGINPHFSVANIDIFDAEQRPALQLRNTELKLSWLSVPLLEPHLANLTIRNPELTIRRVTSGEIFVAGISTRGESKPDAANWLLRQSHLKVQDAKVVWLDEMRQAPALSLDQLNLDIASPAWKSLIKNHEVKFSAVPSAGTYAPIALSGNVYGSDVSKIEQWRGSLTVSIKNANLVAFKPWLDYPIDLQHGIGSTRLNVKFGNERLHSIHGQLGLTNVQLQLKPEIAPVAFKTLTGTMAWTNLTKTANKNAKGIKRINPLSAYSFNVSNLNLLADNGLNLQNAEVNFTQNLQAQQSLDLSVPQLNLQALTPFVLQLPLPADVHNRLQAMAPKGTLNQLTLRWQGQPQPQTNDIKTVRYDLRTQFKGLGLQAYEQVPGFENISGDIQADQDEGSLRLDTNNAQLDFKTVLRWPVPITQMQGNVSWEIEDQATEIKVDRLVLSNPHVAGTLNAEYLMDGKKGGYLNLIGKFGKGDAKFAPYYYPTMLGEATLHWLDTSILAGRAEDINLVVKGRLGDFPFVDSKNRIDPKLGTFRVTAKVSNSVLEYGTGWPLIEDLGLNLLFEGKRMELNANTGRIFGNQIVKSRATIEQLDAVNPILDIVSEAKGPVVEGIRFVNNSPVIDVTQGFTDDLKTSGNGKLNLSLKIPMENVDASKYKGVYQIVSGSMESESIPTLTRINGTLEFTESSLSAKNIRAAAFGAPVVFSLASGKDKAIRVGARGRVTDEAIKQTLGKGADYISGSSEWLAEIIIQKPRLSIAVRSDLYGITSKLPAPLDKAANERVNLRIDKKQDLDTDVTNVNFGNRLGARILSTLENGSWLVNRGVVNITDRASNSTFNPYYEFASLNSAPKGLQLYGNLDYLDADAWLDVMHAMQEKDNSNTAFGLGKADLKINTLDIFDRRLNQLRIQNKSSHDDLQFNLQSREISGDIQWSSQNNGKLTARLSNLTIPGPASDAAKAGDKSKEPALQETVAKDFKKLDLDYPALDITASNFEFDKKKFGTLELVAYPQNDDWIIQRLKLSNPDSTISADGEWNNWVRNPHTRLNVSWDMKDLGNTMNRMNYPDTIKDGEGQLTGQLNWAGSPHEFDTLSLNGTLQFEVRKGQILKVQPGVGRLFGLLSLQSLPRRLSLDFRDLFNSGFAFDKINANVRIDRGVLRSDNFMMTGPAADVSIKGETNLRQETQQLRVKVIPHISDSVSLAALAGGPLAGAVAFLAQKVLKDPLNKIVSTEYEIAGTWDNPHEVKAPEAATSDTNPLR